MVINQNQLRKPEYVFIELENHGISIGFPIECLGSINVDFSNYSNQVQPPANVNIVREVIDLDLGGDPECGVILRVYFDEDEGNIKGLKIYKVDNGNYKSLGGIKNKEKHGIWAGYLQTYMKPGDPSIALGE